MPSPSCRFQIATAEVTRTLKVFYTIDSAASEDALKSNATSPSNQKVLTCTDLDANGFWIIDAVGPFRSSGGDGWGWMYSDIGSLSRFSLAFNEILAVNAFSFASQDSSGVTLGNPPLLAHHAHVVNDIERTGELQRFFIGNLLFTEGGLECANGASPRPNPGNFPCIAQYLLNAKVMQPPLQHDGFVLDLRPHSLTTIEWWYKVALFLVKLDRSELRSFGLTYKISNGQLARAKPESLRTSLGEPARALHGRWTAPMR